MKAYKLTVLAAVLSLGLVQCTNTTLLPKEADKEDAKKTEKVDEKEVKEGDDTKTPDTPEDPANPTDPEKKNPNLLEGKDKIINTLRSYSIPKGMLASDEGLGKRSIKQDTKPGNGKVYNNGGVLTDPNIGNEPGIGYKDGTELDGVKLYRNKRRYEEATYSEPLVLATFMESIYPGMVLKSDQITNGAFATVREFAINPITVSGNWLAAQGTDATALKSKVFDTANLSTYEDWRKDIFQNYPEEGAVKSTIDIKEIDLTHEGGFSASYEAKTLMDLGFKLDFNASKNKSYLLVRFVQNLYTISMDVPRGGLLHNIDISDLNGFKPVYVSDIHYGRICYALFSSDALAVDLRASVEAMQKMIFGMSQGGGGSINYSHIFDESQVQYVIIGGNQDDHASAMISNSGRALRAILSQRINIRNAAPIAFNLRFADDNSRARVMQATEMPLQEAIFIPNSQHKLDFGAQITEIKATYGALKKANLSGKVTIRIPGVPAVYTNLQLLNNGKKDPLVLDADGKFHSVRNKTSKSTGFINLDLFMDKDKAAYYDKPVEIQLELNFSGMSGVIDGKKLIRRTIKKPLRDFIFDCQDGEIIVETEGLGATKEIQYKVAIRIALDQVVTKNYQ